jgi:hypothetical protein
VVLVVKWFVVVVDVVVALAMAAPELVKRPRSFNRQGCSRSLSLHWVNAQAKDRGWGNVGLGQVELFNRPIRETTKQHCGAAQSRFTSLHLSPSIFLMRLYQTTQLSLSFLSYGPFISSKGPDVEGNPGAFSLPVHCLRPGLQRPP